MEQRRTTAKGWVRPALLLGLAALLITLGALQGDFRDIFLKATTICLECIGIG